MDFSANQQLGDLQITNLLGEGGFAKVFRGLWRGLTVGIKIVVDDGKNEKMVMKNAHEIAILSTLSHPHVTQVGFGLGWDGIEMEMGWNWCGMGHVMSCCLLTVDVTLSLSGLHVPH